MAGVADASAGAAVKRIRQQPCGKADRREIVAWLDYVERVAEIRWGEKDE